MNSSHTKQKLSNEWFLLKKWEPFLFQQQCWNAFDKGKSGLLNAPTGSGKTYALALPALEYIASQKQKGVNGLMAIWITPIRALANDLQQAISDAASFICSDAIIASRTGDTSSKERQQQKRNSPNFLITTPESLQLMLAQKGSTTFFENLGCVVVDEWHELIGGKRGVLVELALSRLRSLSPHFRTWGISATIGNLEEAMEVLLGNNAAKGVMIKADLKKQIEIISIIPDEMDTFPWAGHLGTKLIDKVLPIIHQAKTTLVFTNTRAQTEIWYQALLNAMPELAGSMAMHHGSINNDLRYWVEQQLHTGDLKVVVCTSSLDLGVDFRPVEQVIQVGGPKGIARFLQRAGRSGHQPGAVSKIYFLPTHAIELMEASAMRKAISLQKMESKIPVVRAFDVLCQYLVSLSVGDGLDDEKVYEEVKSTYCFNSITYNEWDWVMHFITQGGKSLYAYDEFKKVELDTDGKYRVLNKRIALRHRLSIGVIVSDPSIEVKYMSGSRLGTVEEYFISKMKPGDVFTFAGKSLEILQFKDLAVLVRKVNRKGAIASWQGGRLPLSNKLSEMLREGIGEYKNGSERDTEYAAVDKVLSFQQKRSVLPTKDELLIEKLQTKEGYHVFVYPFEGRNVHEGLSGLMAYRISRQLPISFSIAFNDYGFELLSDQPIPIENALEEDVFSENDLFADIMHSINSMEMAKRKFRDIANIAGLIFTGFPGKNMKTKHLQASSSMFFKVLSEHETDNLLVKQAYEEVLLDQLEELRLRETLKRIGQQQIRLVELSQPSPFAFPIMVDRLREKMSSETIEDRVKKMQMQLIKS